MPWMTSGIPRDEEHKVAQFVLLHPWSVHARGLLTSAVSRAPVGALRYHVWRSLRVLALCKVA